MIINRRELKNRQVFKDSRGESGMSGRLYTLEDTAGTKYLVKTNLADVLNEYVAHNIAKIIGVPTSDAVLITSKTKVVTGIVYEHDFIHANLNDFVGLEEYPQKNIRRIVNGEIVHPLKVTEIKYPDNSPFLADIMAYEAFRVIVELSDNIQLAFVQGHIISFDYADAFCLNDNIGVLLKLHDISLPLAAFKNMLFIENGYKYSLQSLRRADSDFLRNAYSTPMKRFLEADFTHILDELNMIFPQIIPEFFNACFNEVREKIGKYLKSR